MNNFDRIDIVGDPIRDSLRAEETTQQFKIEYLQKEGIEAILYPVVGVDISSWQGVMDWGKAKTKIHFAFLRAGVGNSTADPTFVFNRSECIKKDLVWSMYWFLKPDKNPFTTADNFAAMAKDVQYRKIPVWADIETNGGLDKSALAGWMTKFYKRFISQAPEINLGWYTSPGFANANFWGTEFQDIIKWGELWDANWTSANEPEIPWCWSKIKNPKTYLFWQWTSKGNGSEYGASSPSIDLNRYHYTIGDFNARFDAHIEPIGPTPPPPPDVVPERVMINVANLNIRNSTVVSNNTIIGQTSLGKIWYPDGIERDASGRIWYWFGSKKKIYLIALYTKVI